MIIPLRQIRQRRAQRRNALILAQAMPSFASLLGVLVSSGQQPRQALTTFVESSPAGNLSALANDLGPVARALAVGADFAEAIDRLDATTPIGLSLYRVLDLLRRGEADGLDLAVQLEFVVQDLRRDRSIALDTVAQRLTVALLFPLVLCILPAFLVLAIVPLLLDVLSQLPA